MKSISLIVLLSIITLTTEAQVQKFAVNDQWIEKIESIAPNRAEVTPKKARKVLVFDLRTGFDHWVTPHTDEVIKILGRKTGAFEVDITDDIYAFEAKNLKQYDAIFLNNNCSKGPQRNMFLDVLIENSDLSETERVEIANKLEANLIKYVSKGGGLMVIHGAIVMQNSSKAFGEMVGGSFDYHPAHQKVTLKLVDSGHPLVKAFNGEVFVHEDEPYLFNNAYTKKNFRPLLYMNTSELKTKKPIDEDIKYVSWIKKHGKGRVFYVSPSHSAQSFENASLLKFYLDGAQYVLGDLKCDDSVGGLID